MSFSVRQIKLILIKKLFIVSFIISTYETFFSLSLGLNLDNFIKFPSPKKVFKKKLIRWRYNRGDEKSFLYSPSFTSDVRYRYLSINEIFWNKFVSYQLLKTFWGKVRKQIFSEFDMLSTWLKFYEKIIYQKCSYLFLSRWIPT